MKEDCRTGGPHRFEEATTIGSATRVLLCVYCDAKREEPLNLIHEIVTFNGIPYKAFVKLGGPLGDQTDFHQYTADSDKDFHTAMDKNYPNWRAWDPSQIRYFAKNWNFHKLYRSSPPWILPKVDETNK
jgi:hypothetical protein